MDNYKKKAIQLISELALKRNTHPEVIPYLPAKLSISKNEKSSIKRAKEQTKIKYTRAILDLIYGLEEEKRANVHSIMVIKDDEVIFEASAPGYDVNGLHLAHSMSKTVTGLAIGFLFDDALITADKKVKDFFPEISFRKKEYESMTVADLLTMKSGSPFAELGSVTEESWTEGFFSSEPQFYSGEKFAYNSMNSYILGRIVTKVTGITLDDFVAQRLFKPLDIDNYIWEKSPEGFTKGGFGLYLSTESFAKIGMLILSRGTYGGKRIISEKFIEDMTRVHSFVPYEVSKSGFDYGFHIWVKGNSEEILLNGMLGQNVWIHPSTNTVVAVMCGNNELFSDSPMLSIIRNTFIHATAKEPTRYEKRKLNEAEKNFFKSRHKIKYSHKKITLSSILGITSKFPFDKRFESLIGSYAVVNNNSSLLPLFVSVMQNNYSGGIEELKFEKHGDGLFMLATEGGSLHTIPLGLYEPKRCTVNFNGEHYIVMSSAEVTEDENHDPLYKIELIFPELPNVRTIRISHTDNGLQVKLTETPNQRIAESFFGSMTEGIKMNFALNLLEKKMGEGFINSEIEALFNPTLDAISTSKEGWRSALANENERIISERNRRNKPIMPIISKFFGEEKNEQTRDDKGGMASFLSKALSLIFGRARANEEETASDNVIEIPDDAITFLTQDDAESNTDKNS